MDKSSVIFGNVMKESDVKSARSKQQSFINKYGDDRQKVYHLKAEDNSVVGEGSL